MNAVHADDILNSLNAHVAVLDATGTVVAVNDSWLQYASDNGGASTGFVGTNYLAVCERAARRGDASAAEALKGIRAVMDGERPSFRLEYPCPGSRATRWFVLRVTRLTRDTAANVVISHEDMTEQKNLEHALRKTEEILEKANRELQASLDREQLLARTDGLTGLYNRRYFFEIAERECSVARRHGRPLSVVMIDIDHFKQINDNFGHQAGDEVLACVAKTVAAHRRSGDIVARYGGEEFVLMLPETTAQNALAVAEQLRIAVAAEGLDTPSGRATFTISAGVAPLDADTRKLEQLIRKADQALYAAKAQGRNRSILLSTPRQSA